MLQYNKKGVVSLTTFSFIVLILILISSFSYWYYDSSKSQVEAIIYEKELINGMGNLRAALLNLVVAGRDSYMNYSSDMDPEVLHIYLDERLMIGDYDYSDSIVYYNMSSVGVSFCSNYSVYTGLTTKFYFNGSCIRVLS